MRKGPCHMKILVCGGRDYNVWEWMREYLDRLVGVTHCITGGATGADAHAEFWAWEKGIQIVVCPANWNVHGKAAGYIRNKRMIELRPDLVIAFPGGKGTANMIQLAKDSGIRCDIAPPEPDTVVSKENTTEDQLEP